jgi:hypothetical protein
LMMGCCQRPRHEITAPRKGMKVDFTWGNSHAAVWFRWNPVAPFWFRLMVSAV